MDTLKMVNKIFAENNYEEVDLSNAEAVTEEVLSSTKQSENTLNWGAILDWATVIFILWIVFLFIRKIYYILKAIVFGILGTFVFPVIRFIVEPFRRRR